MTTSMREPEHVHVAIIGGGQSGLSVGYFLKQRGIPFVILEAHARIGDSWRTRWDTLRLFTSARWDGLAGMPFPAPPHYFPTKDEMGDYLEAYAAKFALPVRTGVRVDRLWREGDDYRISAGDVQLTARHVVIAMASYQRPRVPAFAAELAPDVMQLHSREYRNVGQLREGGVLIAGAGNSGAEIAMDVVRAGHDVWLAGRDVGHVPFRIDSPVALHLIEPVLFRVFFHRVLTVDTPIGRKVRPKAISQGTMLIRQKPQDLLDAGIERVGRVAGAKAGRPVLDDGHVLDVTNVIWCTGFHPGLEWVDLPIFDDRGEPRHERGFVPGERISFVGQHFQYSMSSTMIHGVARDAERIATAIPAPPKGARHESGELALTGD